MRTWLIGGLLVLGACGGGELAEETRRREAEQSLDTTTAVSRDTTVDSTYRLPAFVDGVPAADTAVDSLRPPASSPQWTTGVSERPRSGASGITTVRDVRVGRNTGFDRLVIGFGEEPVAGYRVEYGVLPLRSCGSGEPIPLAGQAALVVHLRSTQAHDDQGRVTIPQPDIAARMPVISQVKLICDFEGEVALGVGVVRARPYRVLVEQSPSRLIIDLQQ